MDLYLQFGHGMKSLTLDLAKKWDDVNVILSPRDMTPKQLNNWSSLFEKQGVSTLFDPQCYCPKEKLKNLSQYEYWDSSLNTHVSSGDTIIQSKIKSIKNYNDIAKTSAYIVPCILHQYDEDWAELFVSQQKRWAEAAKEIMNDKPIYLTLALPKEFLIQKEEIIEPVLEKIMSLPVDGCYIIAETLEKKYLVDNPMWLSNILHICASLKISGKKIIYGYGNHQMLLLSLLKTDAMASGTWLNVRSFTNRFIDSDDFKRKSTWYYHPKSLSEYKMTFMDWAYNNNFIDSMKIDDPLFLNDASKKIFLSSVSPTSTGFNQSDAFYHYLNCLNHQVELLNYDSYSDTISGYEMLLETAEREIERLEKRGMYGQTRSFRDIIDINRAAMYQLDKGHGFQLKMSWNNI